MYLLLAKGKPHSGTPVENPLDWHIQMMWKRRTMEAWSMGRLSTVHGYPSLPTPMLATFRLLPHLDAG